MQKPIGGFATITENFDNQVGDLLELLFESDVDEDALILFANNKGSHHECRHDPDFCDSN